MMLHECQIKYNAGQSSELEAYCRREGLNPINNRKNMKKEKRQLKDK